MVLQSDRIPASYSRYHSEPEQHNVNQMKHLGILASPRGTNLGLSSMPTRRVALRQRLRLQSATTADDDGELLISPVADTLSLDKMGIPPGHYKARKFNSDQRHFLDYHRSDVFLQPDV